jgi:hypothetical protein
MRNASRSGWTEIGRNQAVDRSPSLGRAFFRAGRVRIAAGREVHERRFLLPRLLPQAILAPVMDRRNLVKPLFLLVSPPGVEPGTP